MRGCCWTLQSRYRRYSGSFSSSLMHLTPFHLLCVHSCRNIFYPGGLGKKTALCLQLVTLLIMVKILAKSLSMQKALLTSKETSLLIRLPKFRLSKTSVWTWKRASLQTLLACFSVSPCQSEGEGAGNPHSLFVDHL